MRDQAFRPWRMFVSTRRTFDDSNPSWASYLEFIQLPFLTAVRTVDSGLSECVGDCGSFFVNSLKDAAQVASSMLPRPVDPRDFYLLVVDEQHDPLLQEGQTCRLLGYDLTDETHVSTLLNCGPWDGELSRFTERLNAYGLLSRADALEAQAILPRVWPDNPHAYATVWALYELKQPAELVRDE